MMVAGNIASGKSTAAAVLARVLGLRAYHEGVAANPYFEDFYADPGRWAFHSQLAFMTSAAGAHIEIGRRGEPAVQDRGIHEMHAVFNAALRSQGHLSGRDYNQLARLLAALDPQLCRPRMLLYLHAPVDDLLVRTSTRGRPAEQGISREYLLLLDEYYRRFVEASTAPVTVHLDTSVIDVRTVAGGDVLVRCVEASLAKECASLDALLGSVPGLALHATA